MRVPENLMTPKKLTIRDVAKLADVSHMTVSRVMNNDPRVKPETRERILKLINDLRYRPDPTARMFASRKSFLLGLIVSDIRNPFYAELARGIEEETYKNGYSVLFCSTDNRPERIDNYVNHMIGAGVEGIMFASARLKEPIVEQLISERFPIVLMNRKIAGNNCNYVVIDNCKGAYDITKYLIGSGYKRIGLVSGPNSLSTGKERLNGYKKALAEHGIEIKSDYIFQGPFTKETGYEGALKLLNIKSRPDALFAGNDYIAMGVLDAIEEKGLRVPRDIAVVGFDDTEFASNKRINLTTVSQRQFEMGSLGAKILINYIESKQSNYVHQIVLEPKIIIRESCGNRTKNAQKTINKIDRKISK